MQLISPPLLKVNDTVYIVSPSAGLFPFAKERVDRATKNLSSLGLNVKIAKNAAKNIGYLSATVKDRVSDIHEAFSDPSCSLVMASIGGNHSNQLLKHLDYDLIMNNPKAFVGYSDNTVLHYALAKKAGLQTYYGPCFLNQFGENPSVLPFTLKHFVSLLFQGENEINLKPSPKFTDELLDWFKNEDSMRPRKLYNNVGFDWWKPGVAEGKALPGAIPSLNHIIATQFAPDFSSSVLMLDIPEGNSISEGMPVADVDSWLTDLDNAGLLSQLHGVVVSRPYRYSKEMIVELKNVILRIFENYDVPILFNLDFGHTDPMVTIPIYAKITLDSFKSVAVISHEVSTE